MDKRNASIIGIVAIASYVANYFLRNMLGVLTPFILNSTSYTKEYLALLSSSYMIAYASGQLFNGIIGDFVKSKYMLLIGLILAGIVSMLFPFLQYNTLQVMCFIVMGYGLSMVRGPLMKIVSENTKAKYARIICVFLSFSSFVGPLIAGLISAVFMWKSAFITAGILAIMVAVFAFVMLTVLERKKVITFTKEKSFHPKDMLGVFKIKGIAFYILIACLAEGAATPVIFWMPTLFNEYIGFDESTANMIFSFISFLNAFVPFLTLALYKLFKENDILIMKLSYLLSIIAIIIMMVIPASVGTIVFLLIAFVMNNIVSALLWSVYIPSLGKTGRVSSANGVLDCSGYIAAGVVTSLFAQAVSYFGWIGLIFAWLVIPIIGLIAALYASKNLKIN